MSDLRNFRDHGLLPFVGRTEEIDRLVRFSEGTIDAAGLRSTLLLGEAGVGKSRLLDDVLVRIEDRGGLPLRLKLIPEGVGSIMTLLAEALDYHPIARSLVGRRTEGTIGSLLPALRRLARLRPTLLVIEDIHLLGDASCREFSLLLDGLTAESLSIILVARTANIPCRGAIEGSLVDEITLAGLPADAVGDLVRRLFGRPPIPSEQQTLVEVTGGNPLALRTTIRSLVNEVVTNEVAEISETDIVPPINPGTIRRIAERRVSSFAAGMLPPLDPSEEKVAAQIAPLGEVFAVESGLLLAGQRAGAIDALLAKGVLIEAARQGPALPGSTSENPPLAFAHSLLHQYFLEQDGASPRDLIRVIAQDLPLISLLPLQMLRKAPAAISEVPAPLRHAAIARITTIARHLNGTSDWGRAVEIWQIGWELFERGEESRDADEQQLEASLHETRLWLMNGRLGQLTQDLDEGQYREHLDHLFALTDGAESIAMVAFRIDACRHQHQLTIDDYPGCLDVWDDVDRLITEHPLLLLSEAHLQFLAFAARTIARYGDTDRCRRLKSRLQPFLREEGVPEELRLRAHIHVALPLLHAFTTPEELAENMRLAESAEEELLYRNNNVAVGRTSFENAYGGLLFVSGRMSEAIGHATRAERLCRDLGHAAGTFQNRLTRLAAEGALGRNGEDLLQDARQLHDDLPIARHPRLTRMIGTYLAEIGLLRGEYDWVTEVFATFAPEAPHHYIETDVLLGLRSGIDDDLLALLPESGVGNEIRTLLACAQGDHDQADEARRIVDAWLAAPTLGTSDLLRFLLLLKIDAMIIDDGRASILPAENLRDPLENRFTWLAERALFRPMHHLLDLCEDRLPKKKREHWRAESNRIARSWTEEQQRRGEGSRVRIAMIGTIGVRSGSEEPEPIRGGRLKVLLGLLVGTEMLETPLSRDEFHRIASGESDDPNQARKKTNMAVIRLREALGADVIRVGEERHELIRDGVDVDLLQASDLLRTARTAFHSRSLLRAVPALLEALGIVGGEVPFPGLYDDFFESLRDDFELRIRTITLDICGALAAERDHARAEEILRVAYNTMPGDEEIAELLEQTLIALGKKAEATRVFSG